MKSIQNLITKLAQNTISSPRLRQLNATTVTTEATAKRTFRATKAAAASSTNIKLPTDFKPYQDIWITGAMVQHGKRTCGRRYKLIYDCLVERYRPGFTLLDIGASEGYFSIRLSEDFHAQATLLEKKSALSAIVQAQGNPLLKAKLGRFDLNTLKALGNFDVVIALSIVHHFPNWGEVLKRILAMGDTAIIELPTLHERATKRADSAALMLEVLKWYKPTLIGETSGYAEETRRQLWCIDYATPPSSIDIITARVVSGRASSARQAKHYRRGYFEKFATHIYPGTLNLRTAQRLHFKNAIVINSEKGPYCLFPCKIEGLSAYIAKPPRAKNRPNSLEIMARVNLREVFGLKDGDRVLVEIDRDHVGNASDIEYIIKQKASSTTSNNDRSDVEAFSEDANDSASIHAKDTPLSLSAPTAD